MLLKWLGTFFTVFFGGLFFLVLGIVLLSVSWPLALGVVVVLLGATWLQARWQAGKQPRQHPAE